MPLSNSATWRMRVQDFLQRHIAILGMAVLIAARVFERPYKLPLIRVMFAANAYQAIQIFTYRLISNTEVDLIEPPEQDDLVNQLSVNALMGDDGHDDAFQVSEHGNADSLFAMGTNEIWHNALSIVLDLYATIKAHIPGDHHGLIVANRLDPFGVDRPWSGQNNTPQLSILLRAPDVTGFQFIASRIHPPALGSDTAVQGRQLEEANHDVIRRTTDVQHGSFQGCPLVLDHALIQAL